MSSSTPEPQSDDALADFRRDVEDRAEALRLLLESGELLEAVDRMTATPAEKLAAINRANALMDALDVRVAAIHARWMRRPTEPGETQH